MQTKEIHKGNIPPTDISMVWIDTTDPDNPQVKVFLNGKWTSVSDESEDVKDLKDKVDELEDNKVDKIKGKELSANDFTDELKEKLETLDETAEGVHIKSDWNVPAGDSAEILNRPGVDDIPTLNSNNLVKSGGVATQINQLGQKVEGKYGIPVTFENAYIKTSDGVGTTITPELFYPVSGWNCYIAKCKENDVVIVNGSGGLSPRLWAFLDENYTIVSVANASISGTDLELIVPANASFVIINSNSNPPKTSYLICNNSISGLSKEMENVSFIDNYEIEQLRDLMGYKNIVEDTPNLSQGLLLANYGIPRYTIGNYPDYRYTPKYYPVQPGQIIHTNGRCVDVDAGIIYYDESKKYIGSYPGETDIEVDIIVPNGAFYARFCTQTQSTRPLRFIIKQKHEWEQVEKLNEEVGKLKVDSENLLNAVDTNIEKKVFLKGEQPITGETATSFKPKQELVDIQYIGEVNTEKKYLAIGFDDFRDSDFDVYVPLFEKYGYRATFNRIAKDDKLASSDKVQINNVILGRHELGDHTFRHYKFPFDEPLFNGQDPDSLDGNQVPFPSNSQLREDRGDGKNVFGRPLTETMATAYAGQTPSWRPPISGTKTWATLSNEDCQILRNWYSVMKDTDSKLIVLLDELSNRYLGTSGNSNGSWDNQLGCYTGGIFTGCKTSANHEIWERYLQIMTIFYKEEMGLNYNLKTWSLPGSKGSRCYFENDGKFYYDESFNIPMNDLARMESSLYKKQDGTNKVRSWTDVLREFGYTVTHDSTFPGRSDGQTIPAMSIQYIYNAWQSRKDGLIFPTNRTLSFSTIENEFPENFFDNSASIPTQMYNAENSSFKKAIEAWRMWMSSGVIWGEVLDSSNSYSMKTIIEQLLAYCKVANIEVITKQEAFDICFRHKLSNGNLIYNPRLRNTAKEFMPDNPNVPNNPDGYSGNCSVFIDTDGRKVLDVLGNSRYYHFGIPLGELKFSCKAKGTGRITFAKIFNKTAYNYGSMSGTWLGQITVNNSESFEEYSFTFYIPDSPLNERDGICEYYGDKIIGILVSYIATIQVKDIDLRLI